ncbi:MAG TPA: hypothetical protein PLU17_07365, partial [Chitinophagaceae bacterium]|nr:hypothetical protein [Chitinophagaceae bacterium]
MKHILHLYLTQGLISLKLCCLLLFISFHVQAQVAGDLRSSSSGSWNQPNTWERYTGTVWQAAGIGANNPGHIPDTNSSVFIQTGHLVNLDSISFCNSISINGGTLEANIYTLNVKNNWTNNGDFIANTGLVNLFGPNQLIGGASITSFNHLTVATTVTAELTQHLIVLGNLTTTSTGTLKTESFNVTVSGLTSVEGLSSIKDIGSGSKQYFGGLFINGGSFVSTVPITIPSSGILNVALGNLTMNAGTSTFLVEAGAPITISGGNLSIAAGQTFSLNSPVNMSGGSINGNGSLFINSTFNMSGGVLAGSGTSTVTAPNIMNISGTLTTISRSITTPTLNWASGGFTIGSGSILSTITAQISSSGVISGNGTLVVSGIGASLTKSSNSNATINCALNLTNPSVFNINSGTLTLGGGGILSSATTRPPAAMAAGFT